MGGDSLSFRQPSDDSKVPLFNMINAKIMQKRRLEIVQRCSFVALEPGTRVRKPFPRFGTHLTDRPPPCTPQRTYALESDRHLDERRGVLMVVEYDGLYNE